MRATLLRSFGSVFQVVNVPEPPPPTWTVAPTWTVVVAGSQTGNLFERGHQGPGRDV